MAFCFVFQCRPRRALSVHYSSRLLVPPTSTPNCVYLCSKAAYNVSNCPTTLDLLHLISFKRNPCVHLFVHPFTMMFLFHSLSLFYKICIFRTSSHFPDLMVTLDVGGLGFEFCVFVAGWRHALRSEWPFIFIINNGHTGSLEIVHSAETSVYSLVYHYKFSIS